MHVGEDGWMFCCRAATCTDVCESYSDLLTQRSLPFETSVVSLTVEGELVERVVKRKKKKTALQTVMQSSKFG